MLFHRLDLYASLLHKRGHTKELEKMVPTLSTAGECTSEVYVAMAYTLYGARKWNRANTLASQALNLNSSNVEAIILRGNILLEQKKYQDALHQFRQAMQLKPYRYEPHKGCVDCFVGMHRLREALNIASSGCKQLGQTPRAISVSKWKISLCFQHIQFVIFNMFYHFFFAETNIYSS